MNYSDHKKPSNNINNFLPEVYKSDVNQSVFDMAFNRHLTKDDTARVAGFVGQGNPAALVDRQIKEATPHRQAFQLAPTMLTKVGTDEVALSFKAYQSQLSLMGVDLSRMQLWGNALQFNWAPPINIDMLVNYQDYFWKPTDATDTAQYITIENRCNKVQSKTQSYANMLSLRGDTFPINVIGYSDDTFVVSTKVDDMFRDGFQFYTDATTNPNLLGRQWTAVSSTYDSVQDLTTITIAETIASAGTVPPTSPFYGQWWYDTGTGGGVLKEWNGSSFVLASPVQAANIDLTRQLQFYEFEANCICNGSYGWDTAAWDDNSPPTSTPWYTTWLNTITFATSADWVIANGAPALGNVWYEPTADILYAYKPATMSWDTHVVGYSSHIERWTNESQWDASSACATQSLNPWSSQNHWVHKSQVQSFADVKRAQLPIIEYNSTMELNEWAALTYSWKYRDSVDNPFTVSTTPPARFELEPIRGYVVVNISGAWTIFFFDQSKILNRDIDHTSVFTPGFKFKFTDDSNLSEVYTVASSEYRQIVGTDPIAVTSVTGLGYLCTVVTLAETTFTSTPSGGGVLNARFEPILTSHGQTWRGYHVHWLLDTGSTVSAATSNQPWNMFLRDGIDNPPGLQPAPAGVHFDDSLPFEPAFPITIAGGHQEQNMSVAGVTRIDLVDQFRLNSPSNTVATGYYATPGSNELRVYVNGTRQYATFTEITDFGTPPYTLVGSTPQTTQQIEYVKAIVFDTPLELFDMVRIEVGPAAQSDMGMYCVPVRTIEDETAFTLATAVGTQPVYRSLTKYQKLEQAKTAVNQYPMFNVYDVVTNEVVKASPVFMYRESSTAQINSSVGKRIVASTDGKEYEFEQTLLDRDDNILYAYRNVVTDYEYWYNPLSGLVKWWNVDAWTSYIPVLSAGGIVYRTAVVASLEPAGLVDVDGALWLDTSDNTLYQSVSGSWAVRSGLIVNITDPSLQTIWKHGLTSQQYVPEYVDETRQPVTVGDVNGDWEVVDQWTFNPEHQNKQYIKYSQLITHFRTILDAQVDIPGLLGGGAYTLAQNQIDYGVGGTIKEHNDGYDTLISAVNVTNVTPVGVIEFAQQQYASGLLTVRDIFNKSLTALFSDLSPASLLDFSAFVSSTVIAQYETNDYYAQLYSDTIAYNSITGAGVQNWVATAPMLGLTELHYPYITVQNGDVELFHHDGHRSRVEYTGAEIDKYSRMICALPDSRSSGSTFGKVSASAPPTTEAGVVTDFGFIRPTLYWYRVGGGIRTLHRLTPYGVGGTGPSFYDQTGAEIPDGTMYYNTTTSATYEKVGLSWVAITALGAGDITPLWKEIDLALLVAEVQLEVERRLYQVTPVTDLVFDYSSLTPNASEQSVYDGLLRERFSTFLADANITTPFINSEYTSNNAFTWNYTSSTPLTPPRFDITPTMAACWQQVYTRWYGTPYPHMEPWCLQGFSNKPLWWDDEYLDTTGGRRWIYTHATTTGMWENIRIGHVPAGRTYPNGAVSTGNSITDGQVLPTYNYFSVNISDSTIPGGYAPDDVLPPYYDNASIVGTVGATVRSILSVYASEINAPDADYAFGDYGPAEWAWSVSGQRPYDDPVIAFLMQPVRFLHYTFGPTYTDVAGLQVDVTFKQVYSHEDALFHGDVYDTDKTYLVRGINQWYVNYNRFTGTDTNGEFRQLWAGWNPKLTYQFGGIVDTSTFEISNKYFDVINQDYNIILANNGVIDDLWVDAFEVSLLSIPPALVQYNNQAAWKMELDSLSTVARDIKYYGVKSYQFTVDPATDVCTAFVYPMMSANSPARRFGVDGDHTSVFSQGTTFTVSGSPWNNGTYTVSSSIFETTTNRTRINVEEPVPFSNAAGQLNLNKALPWSLGDQVVIGSSKFLPAPLLPNTPYYVIPLTGKTFRLAETKEEAISNSPIDLISSGEGSLRVSQVESSFYVFGGQGNTQDLWFHYALDTSDVRTFTPPYTILGMQTLINVIDGYAAYQRAQGVIQNVAVSSDFDPDTGRQIDWTVETERFIDWAYGLRQSRVYVADRYPVTADATTDEVTFGAFIPQWPSGTAVVVTSSGDVPTPIVTGSPYYVVNTSTSGVILLSTSANPTDTSSYVDLTSVGSGQVMIGLYDKNRAFPRFEMNATRNNMWIDTPLGVLSNVVTGPYTDIRVKQTIFDQYSRPVGPDKITVYRQDLRSHIAIRPEIPNDIDLIYTDDPYNYVHMGGAHLFVEGYEHFLVFNDYTVGGSLIYNPFLGLQATKFGVDYFEKEQYTLRPTLGGYYLLDSQFYRNIEGSASDMQNYYDVMELSETSDVARRSRALLGYHGRTSYLDFLNVNSKSQFQFYRGMIQTKGSVNSVKAYINSRRFVDAKLDEFWAWKIAEYGDSRVRMYPEVKLFSTDGALDDVRLEFLADSELATDPDVVEAVDNGFQLVTFKDESRWNVFPEQKQLIQSPLFLDSEVSSLTLIYAGVVPPPPGAETTIKYWFNKSNNSLYEYDASAPSDPWSLDVTDSRAMVESVVVGTPPTATNMLYYRLNEPCDAVRVIRRALTSATYIIGSVSGTDTFVIPADGDHPTGDFTGDITVGVPFTVYGSDNNDGYYYPTSVVVTPSNTTEVTVSSATLTGGGAMGFIAVKNFSQYTTEIFNPGEGLREFTRVDSEVVRFNADGFEDIIMIFTLNPAAKKLSPAKLIDTKANTVVQQVPIWDPARGRHSHIAIHNVDLQNHIDPARYQFTPNPTVASENFWNDAEVGTVWLDTEELGYLQYYDDVLYPDINDRLYNWGKLAPWASIRVYQWVRSTIPPSEWDAQALQHLTDSSIPQNEKTTGTPRRVVFKRVREQGTFTLVGTLPTQTIETTLDINDGDQILVTAENLPDGLEAGVKYTVNHITGDQFTLTHPDTESLVTVSSPGTGTLNIVPVFVATDWVAQTLIREHVLAPFMMADVRLAAGETSDIVWPHQVPLVTPEPLPRIMWTPANPSAWVLTGTGADTVDVYINGVLRDASLPIMQDGQYFYVNVAGPLTLNEYDMIDIVRSVHAITPAEAEFDPDVTDDGVQLIQWKADYQYSTRTLTYGGTDTGTTSTTYYFFWVENMTTRDTTDATSLSVFEVARQLETIPTPHFVIQKPKDDTYLIEKYGYGVIEYGSVFSLGILTDADYVIPVMYREAVIRKIASYINDDNRYVIRFTRDWSLRDDIQANGLQLNLKNKHQEWLLFRENQTSTIPRELWDRLTEALAGRTLADSTVRVPSLERELYDATYGTDTRFGLGVDQAFVDKSLGLSTILAYLTDPQNDFTPTDVDAFFATYAFDTPDNIISAMNAIYTVFNAAHVNAMWFDTLSDALSTRAKYRELMKTSWIALHGIRVLEVGGMFDD